MQRHIGKLKSRIDLGKLTGKMLRLLRSDVKLYASLAAEEESLNSQLIQPAPVHVYPDSFKNIKSALLNAERKKAEALMELQRRRFIC